MSNLYPFHGITPRIHLAWLAQRGTIIGNTIPPMRLAAGAPAGVKKELPEDDYQWIARGAGRYIELALCYRTEDLEGHGPAICS